MVLCTVCFYSIGVRISISRLSLKMTVLAFFAYILLDDITTNMVMYELVLIVRDLLLSVFKTHKNPSEIHTVFVYTVIKLFYIRPVEKTQDGLF